MPQAFLSTDTSRLLAMQGRVVHALIARELLTRYGRRNIGFLWVFVEPVLFTLGIAWLWSLTKAATMPGVSVVAFALTGYSAVLLWRNAATRCTQALSTNWALLYHRGVTPLDIYIARILIEIGAATASLLVLTAVFVAAGQMSLPIDPFRVLAAWFGLSAFAVGFALVIGSLAERSDSFERIWHVMTYLLFPISGAMFMAHWLPGDVREVVLWLPMVHGVEMLRGGWFGPTVMTYESPGYFFSAIAALLLVGLLLVRTGGRPVEAH